VEIVAEGLAGFLVEGRHLAAEEEDGLALEAALPFLVGFEDGARAGAKRAVVEEVDGGVEEEEGLQDELLP